MPGEDGLSLIRRVRLLPPGGGGLIPAAALSAYAGAGDRRSALLAGFQHHVAKPVDPAHLLAVIATDRPEGAAPPCEARCSDAERDASRIDRRRRPGLPGGARRARQARGLRRAQRPTLKQAREEIAANPPDILLVDLHLPDGSGLSPPGGPRARVGPRGRPDHRKRERRNRGGRPSPRRRRLSDEAGGLRPRQDGPRQRDPRPGDAGRDQHAAGRAAQAGSIRAAGRRIPAHAEGLRPDRPRGRDRRQHPHQRRDRHRKGAGRRDDPRPEPPQQGSVPSRELRGPVREPDRERAVRPRARQLHRRGPDAQGILRARRRRNPVSRRDHGGRRHPGQAAPGAGDVRGHPGRRNRADQGRRAHRRRHQPPRRGGDRGRQAARGPVLPPERLPDPASSAAGARRRRRAPGREVPRAS